MRSLLTSWRPLNKEKAEEAKKRKHQDEAHGAEEPVWKLKRAAHLARKRLRDGERLARKVLAGSIQWARPLQTQELLDDFPRQYDACPS